MFSNYELPYLNDNIFLKQLFSSSILTYFVNIVILDWQQNPIEQIQGKCLSASFSIDGNSSLRRTGNLSFLFDQSQNIDIYNLISINKKINVQVGFENYTDKYLQYSTFWFPLGLYIISDISITNSSSGLTVALQLKDKMCLLNGDCGGTLPASTIFDNYQTIDENGDIVIKRPTIYQIILELVNHFGGEQLSKIIISDVDTRIKQVMKWTKDSPLYFVEKLAENSRQYQVTTSASQYSKFINEEGYSDVPGSPFEKNNDVGYIYTDFCYPGELIGDAGNTVVDILEKIKQTLGNYEYFYDLNGNFIFQQIKNYLNNSQSKYILQSLDVNKFIPEYILQEQGQGAAYQMDFSAGKSVFSFNDSNLIMSYSNSPSYSMIKNDFVVWGLRKNSSQTSIPVRYHLVIDKKPQTGNTYQAFKYTDPNDNIEKWYIPKELDRNKKGTVNQYYIDGNNKIYTWILVDNQQEKEYQYVELNDVEIERVTTTDWRTQLYFQGLVAQKNGTDRNYYYAELLNEWPKIYDIVADKEENGEYINESGFKKQFLKNPNEINYFLDFIDSTSESGQFSVPNIGRRSLVVNQNQNVNCVFEKYIPDVVFINTKSAEQISYNIRDLQNQCRLKGQDWYQVDDNIYNYLTIGGVFNSGYDYIRQLLYQYTSYNNSVTLETLPMFFLQPNTRITITDDNSKIQGDYIINTISFSLENFSSMNINATKALEKI